MRITESSSNYRHLEQMDIKTLLYHINQEDQSVPIAIANTLEAIERLVVVVVDKMQQGGRLFYIGAGTSGRLGVVDASECPPTFGVPHEWVIGIIAGGDSAIRKAVEFAEDSTTAAWNDLQQYAIQSDDVVVGIAASGSTPYVVGGLHACRLAGITTSCIVCNPNSAVEAQADYPIVVVTGPEFVTGSTRMKAGTAQKLVLNMISTAVMIRLGRVHDNKMVDMQLSNNKLIERGANMLVEKLGCSHEQALAWLAEFGSVRQVLLAQKHI